MNRSNLLKKIADMLRKPKPVKTRFIVLAKYRVGSTYLRSLLNSHKNILVQSELFNVSQLSLERRRIDRPIASIDEVFRNYDHDLEALGFKLMYNQLSSQDFDIDNWPDSASSRIRNDITQINRHIASKNLSIDKLMKQATDYLVHELNLKVIHLKRRNMLDTLVSTKRAFMEDNWVGLTFPPVLGHFPGEKSPI